MKKIIAKIERLTAKVAAFKKELNNVYTDITDIEKKIVMLTKKRMALEAKINSNTAAIQYLKEEIEEK